MSIEAFASQLASGAAYGPTAYGIALLGGLIAGVGPCVLPMLPAVFGYVTGSVAREVDEETRSAAIMRRGFVLSAVFVLGMSLVFAAIGAAAGMLGHALLLGAWAAYILAGICLLVGLQMLGLIDLKLDRLNAVLPMKRPKRAGMVGAFVFGALFGLVVSPCSTPILAAIATLAATTGSAAKGASLLFVYGVGKGFPLLLLGVASGSLAFMRSLSKATPYLMKIGGVSMLAAAAYLIWIS